MAVELSYCVVNTGAAAAAAGRWTPSPARRHDGGLSRRRCSSSTTPRRAAGGRGAQPWATFGGDRARPRAAARRQRRRPAGAGPRALLPAAQDEDSELEPGAAAALHDELDRVPARGDLRDAGGAPTAAPRLGLAARRERARRPRRRTPGALRARTAAMLVRRDAAARAGSFDPSLGGRAADADFCRRLRHADTGCCSSPTPALSCAASGFS